MPRNHRLEMERGKSGSWLGVSCCRGERDGMHAVKVIWGRAGRQTGRVKKRASTHVSLQMVLAEDNMASKGSGGVSVKARKIVGLHCRSSVKLTLADRRERP